MIPPKGGESRNHLPASDSGSTWNHFGITESPGEGSCSVPIGAPSGVPLTAQAGSASGHGATRPTGSPADALPATPGYLVERAAWRSTACGPSCTADEQPMGLRLGHQVAHATGVRTPAGQLHVPAPGARLPRPGRRGRPHHTPGYGRGEVQRDQLPGSVPTVQPGPAPGHTPARATTAARVLLVMGWVGDLALPVLAVVAGLALIAGGLSGWLL